MATYPQDMIPDGRSSKIDMEVGVAACCTHQAVALNLGTHELHIFSRNVRRPVVSNPAQLVNYSRWNDDLTQSAIKLPYEIFQYKLPRLPKN